MTNELVKLDQATRMLAEAKTLEEIKTILDVAEAARVYARAAKLGLEAYNHAAEIKVRAERKAGEMLAQLERSPGGQPTHSNMERVEKSEYSEVLAENEIPTTTAFRWQSLANMPEEEFNEHIEETRGERPITTSGILREINKSERANTPDLPSDKYRIVYADPPWKYGNTMPEYFKEQGDHYQLMTLPEICGLPIKELSDENAVLFLWVTSPILEESFQVIKAWGFEYKSSFIWNKNKHVMGHYNSVRHEFLLVCTRGSCQPDVQKLYDSVYDEDRTDHSRKPEYFRNIIDTIYPKGKRIELFSRSKHEGWDVWGNEVS